MQESEVMKKRQQQPGMAVHACNPSTQKAVHEDHRFRGQPGHLVQEKKE